MPQTSVSSDPAAAFPGMIGDVRPKAVDSCINGEASAEIPFGHAVIQGTLDNEALLPALGTDGIKLLGIVLHSHAYNKDNELGTTGLKPEIAMSVLAAGRVWVPIDENVTPASAVRVRHTTASLGKGSFRASASAGATFDISKFARWVGTHLAATGYGLLEIDVTGRAVATADT
jgi:hypothetical protein